jgi:hypothetical protein
MVCHSYVPQNSLIWLYLARQSHTGPHVRKSFWHPQSQDWNVEKNLVPPISYFDYLYILGTLESLEIMDFLEWESCSLDD